MIAGKVGQPPGEPAVAATDVDHRQVGIEVIDDHGR